MYNISDKTQIYLQMLGEKFNKDKFCEFIKDLLNLEEMNIVNGREQSATSKLYQDYIDTAQLYAKYEDINRKSIGVIIIKLKDNKHPANARTLQRNYIAHLMDYYNNLDASLTAIYSDTDDTWRLSFVKQEITIEVGKIKTKVSPAKRYSYLFGKDEPNHTAKEQLLDLLENHNKQYSIEEIEDKFSVEKVTKDFFEKYKDNYLKLKETLEANEEFVSEANRCGFTSEEFTKKLMGQIVFIYFLQKKGWLGVKLVPSKLTVDEYTEIYNKTDDVLGKKKLDQYYINYDGQKIIKKDLLEKIRENEQDFEILSDVFVNTKYDNDWGTGEKKFIRTIFKNCKDRNKNFFDDYLEPFFYNGLNHKRKNQYFSVFNCKIPFLNGGLFEPLDNYRWESATFNIKNDIFSNENEDGILDFFDRYNFTMNEEEPLEKDVAVDPEMLGKIFENLLDVKDRKSKGAFYTPREIVHYMCQESLANFLVNKVNVKYEEIKEFIQYGEMIRDIDLKDATENNYLVGTSIFENVLEIDKALENIKIADPAVGSGAFPLGMLNEIVKLRDILTSYIMIYNRIHKFDRVFTEKEIIDKRNIYKIKWNTIRNCIYAVDIENSAVDITKLRLWLSIVVEQTNVPKTGPEPLPNLDCKIMQGNSLIDEYDGIKLIDEKFIEELKDRDNVKFNDGGTIRERGRKIQISSNQIQIGDGRKKAQIDDLIRLKQELFGTKDTNRKRELLNKIQESRKELLKLNFAQTTKENEFFEIDKSHNKPYFAWMLEFIEVFIENDGFDIVIGNPPYIDSEGMVNAGLEWEREIISNKFQYAKGNWDIYIAFFELGLGLFNKHNSNLIYITPDKWISKSFGDALRIGIVENIKSAFRAGRNVFETAKVDSLVTCIDTQKHTDIEVVEYVDNKIKFIRKVPKTLLNEPYNLDIIFSDKVDILEKIEEKSIKLESLYQCDNACATADCYKLKEVLESNPIYDNNKMYKLVNTGIIDKYNSRWGQKDMKYLKDNYLYPIVTKEKFHNTFPNAYGKKVNKSKIIIKGMTLLDGMIDFIGEYIPGKSTMIIEIEDIKMLKFISALINSSISIFYIKEKYSSSSYNGGITFNKNMINSLPVVKSYTKLVDECVEIVDKILNNEVDIIEGQNKIDNIFFEELELSKEEIDIVKGV